MESSIVTIPTFAPVLEHRCSSERSSSRDELATAGVGHMISSAGSAVPSRSARGNQLAADDPCIDSETMERICFLLFGGYTSMILSTDRIAFVVCSGAKTRCPSRPR